MEFILNNKHIYIYTSLLINPTIFTKVLTLLLKLHQSITHISTLHNRCVDMYVCIYISIQTKYKYTHTYNADIKLNHF